LARSDLSVREVDALHLVGASN